MKRQPLHQPDGRDSATAIDWIATEDALNAYGNAILPALLTPGQCEALAALYPQRELFRSRIVMARHGFGSGEYKYFAYPLPALLETLRQNLYPHLAPIANRWNRALRIGVHLPGHARCVPATLSRSRPDAADAAVASVRRRRLQLPASGSVR